MTVRQPRWPLLLLLTLCALIGGLMDGGPVEAAGSFNPVSSICLDDQTTVDPNPLVPGHAGECDGSNAPGADVALTGTFGIEAPDYNFGLNVSFTPPEWGVAKGTDVPIGAFVGTLNSNATLGLLGNPCKSPVLVNFTFVNASTNPADTIVPKAPGEDDRLEPLAEDTNGNHIADGADKWPSYLNDIDAFKNVSPSQIRARLFGVNATAVAGLTYILNFIIFEPGADIFEDEVIDPGLGYPSVTVLQDPTVAASQDDPINDFCSPLHSATTTFGVTEDNPNTGTGGGFPYRTNPSDGAYSSIAFSASQRDADGDGIENGLDPCPLTRDDQYGPNNDIAWDPRTQSPTGYQEYADQDADGLPSSCDPNPDVPSPVVGSIYDEDRDQWMNRSDNCPLVKNGPYDAVGNNADEDGDGIGDACDPHPNDADAEGVPVKVCVVNTLEIGAGGTPPLPAGTIQDCDLSALHPGPTPPPHDDFANARPITPAEMPFTDSVEVAAASVQPGEPLGCLFLDSTVWYKFTPSTDQVLMANTSGSSVPEALINVYTGPDPASLGELSLLACGDSVTHDATAGTTYYFQVGDGYGASSGTLVFNLDVSTPPPDTDGDGVLDVNDIWCPTFPEDFDGFQDNDGCPEYDNDMDGICDPWFPSGPPVGAACFVPAISSPPYSAGGSPDRCPNVPEDFDAFKDLDGCPEPDNDVDGFPDVTDDCPGTDFTAGPDGIADTGDEPLNTQGDPIQTREDYDGVIDTDGCHDLSGDDFDGDSLGATTTSGLPIFHDEFEFFYLGTDPAKACPVTAAPDDEAVDAWAPDTNDDRIVNMIDVFKMFDVWGRAAEAPPVADPDRRYDLNADGAVNILDVFLMLPVWLHPCT